MAGRETHPLFRVRYEGGAAYVMLSRGLEAVVDPNDVPLVQAYCWHALVNKSGHAYAATKIDGKPTTMHRHLMEPQPREHIDHVNGYGLDNRRANLRICTHAQNMRNKVLDRRNRTGFRGVAPRNGKFTAEIGHNGRSIKLGTYATAEEAAAAHKGAAKVLWGEFAPK